MRPRYGCIRHAGQLSQTASVSRAGQGCYTLALPIAERVECRQWALLTMYSRSMNGSLTETTSTPFSSATRITSRPMRPKLNNTTPCTAEMTMGQRVTGQVGQQIWVGHVGHGSVLVTRWPMISFFFRHCRDSLRHSLSHKVSLIQLFLRSILWQWWCLILTALPLSGPDWKLQ